MNAAEEIDVTIEGVLADGTPVKAKCRYRAKDISVEMLSPVSRATCRTPHHVHVPTDIYGQRVLEKGRLGAA